MRKIAVLNQKGGVGKTTTVANTAAALAEMGLRVAVLDLDPQAHLTIHFGVDPETIESGAYRVLSGEGTFQDELMMVRPNLWLLPANIDLVGAESELVSVVGRETILREAIESSHDQFDYLIVDCAPSLGLLTLNALAATQEVLIPLQPHFLALQGLGKLLQTVELVNKRINPELKVKGVLLCMYDSRASLPREVKADIESFLENARGTNCAWSQAEVVPVFVRRNIKLAEAPSYGKTIFEYEPHCNGAEDYRRIARFIDGRELETTEEIEKEIPELEEIQTTTLEEETTPPPQQEVSDIQPITEDVQLEVALSQECEKIESEAANLNPLPEKSDTTEPQREQAPPIGIKEFTLPKREDANQSTTPTQPLHPNE